MEDSTAVPPTSWRKDIVEVKAEPKAEPKKSWFDGLLSQVDTVLGGARKFANVIVSTCVVFLIMGVGFGACMAWYSFERRHTFGNAAGVIKEKDPERAAVLQEVGQVCRNDAETPLACSVLLERITERPQLARAER